MNALEAYRKQNGLTFEQLAQRAAKKRIYVWRHCKHPNIPAEAARHYEKVLGIPGWTLRPDLWPAPEPKPVSE